MSFLTEQAMHYPVFPVREIPIKHFNLAPVIADYIKPAPTVIDTHLLIAQLLTLVVAHLLHPTRNHVRSRQRKNSRQEVSEQIQQGRSAVPSGQDCTVPKEGQVRHPHRRWRTSLPGTLPAPMCCRYSQPHCTASALVTPIACWSWTPFRC